MLTDSQIKDAVQGYIDRVLSGDEGAGYLERRAVERHVHDLKHGKKRGLVFDEAAGAMVVKFFSLLKHSKGEWAGRSFDLSPWQMFRHWCVFGWKRSDGCRRFVTAYNEVARKNGKTTDAAGTGLYLFLADGEPGAEIYSAATKREQAKLSHDEAVRMVKASASLMKHVTITRDNLSNLSTNSKYVPLGRDADSTDGLNPHGVIIDELHAHKSRDMLDVLDTATGARRSPILYIITTAGYDRNSVCYEQREHAERVLDGFDKSGGIKDDTFFAFVACIDEGDDWQDEKVWRKANPNLGVSCKVEDLRRKANRAKVTPTALNKFLRLHMGVWTEQSTRWIPMDKWDECALPVDDAALRGRPCYAGLDLATSRDLTALVLAFPDDDGSFDLLLHCWCPRDNAEKRERIDRAPYITWAAAGLMTLTDGDVTDYDVVRHDIGQLGEKYHIKELAVDRLFQGAQLSTQLQDDGFNVVSHGMGFMSMAGPTQEFERLVVGGRLRHGGNPILRWAASNAVVSQDPAGNIKPDKSKANEKIDPIVASIMATGRAMATRDEPVRKLKRGLVVI